jgi:P27 family predicted phage terminase small subunit
VVRGRKPQATAQKEASGAFKKDPQRRNHAEPKPQSGIPEMPGFFAKDDLAVATWNRVTKQLDEMGVMTHADCDLIAMYCVTYAEFVRCYEDVRSRGRSCMSDGGKESATIEAKDLHANGNRILKMQAELGLTPSSRSRLHATKEQKEEDPFKAWLERATN